MGILKTKNTLLETATRRLLEFGERDPAFNQYSAYLKSCGVPLRRIPIPTKQQATLDVSNIMNFSGCPAQSCVGKGVVNLLLRRPRLFSFKEACAILAHCNVMRHRTFIEDIIRKYAVVIVGLQGFAEEDLGIAVYLFIEDMFGIQANIELCVRIITKNCKDNVIGVVFDSITAKEKIVVKRELLEGSGIIINVLFDIDWIVNELCDDEVDA